MVQRYMARTEPIDFDWRFHLGDDPAWASPDYDDGSWRVVDLPHDFSIEGPFSEGNPAGGANAWAPTGVAWYRRRVRAPVSAEPLRARLEFDGIYHNASVYLDGRLVGRNRNGFTSFTVELDTALGSGGVGLVAVRVDNTDVPNCRWYTGSGIYRRVRISFHSNLHFRPWGLAVRTVSLTRRRARLSIHADLRNDGPTQSRFAVVARVLEHGGREVCRVRRPVELGTRADSVVVLEARIDRPRLWSPEGPRLYTVEARIVAGSRELDRECAVFGVRRAMFRAGRGFLLNGRETKLRGVCLHGDGGCVGAAVPPAVWRRRLERLKSIGCNAIRWAHNPPDPQLLDLCDGMGFLVIDEIFDKWEASFAKPEQWWMRQGGFAESWEADLVSTIRRDRNHPCIILWSVGNETGQPGTDQVDPWLGRLAARARTLDPTRPVSTALVQSDAPSVEEKARRVMKSGALVDVLCVNYQEPLYLHYHALDPRKVIIGSESFIHWRGTEGSVHGFGLRNPWYDVLDHPWVAGQFVWPGVDYLGESGWWPLKGWGVGLMDTTGRLKPSGQFHRSVWSREPRVAIAVRDHGHGTGEAALSWGGYSLSAHWNWPELERKRRWPEVGGRLVEVEVQTNCETVELVLNDRSYGEKSAADFPNACVLFLVPYQAGSLRAVGRRGGVVVAQDELVTAGGVAALGLEADRSEIAADGYDVAHVTIELRDARGLRVPRADRLVHVRVEGPARLLGLDNGVLDSPEGYTGPERTTSGGLCLAVVGRSRRTGEIRVRVDARGDDGAPMDAVIQLDAR